MFWSYDAVCETEYGITNDLGESGTQCMCRAILGIRQQRQCPPLSSIDCQPPYVVLVPLQQDETSEWGAASGGAHNRNCVTVRDHRNNES